MKRLLIVALSVALFTECSGQTKKQRIQNIRDSLAAFNSRYLTVIEELTKPVFDKAYRPAVYDSVEIAINMLDDYDQKTGITLNPVLRSDLYAVRSAARLVINDLRTELEIWNKLNTLNIRDTAFPAISVRKLPACKNCDLKNIGAVPYKPENGMMEDVYELNSKFFDASIRHIVIEGLCCTNNKMDSINIKLTEIFNALNTSQAAQLAEIKRINQFTFRTELYADLLRAIRRFRAYIREYPAIIK